MNNYCQHTHALYLNGNVLWMKNAHKYFNVFHHKGYNFIPCDLFAVQPLKGPS